MTKLFSALREETNENPKMLQVYNDKVWHEVFCYALAFEPKPNRRTYDENGKLLMAIISGADGTLQAIKAAMDIGVNTKFGYGEKGLTTFQFHAELELTSEKGKYDKFHMSLNRNRKALAMIHSDLTDAGKYVLSFEGDPAQDIANLLGGSQYGLHILPEWKDIVFHQLLAEKYLVEHEVYCDKDLMDLRMYSIDMTEEQADRFISSLVQKGLLKFPAVEDDKQDEVTPIDEIMSLTPYLQSYTAPMAEKMQRLLVPGHDPLKDQALEHFNSYKRELFPVQSHTATAIAKHLMKGNKAVILQGEMSTGKSAMMTAIVDGLAYLKNKKGYHSILICPPSLTSKWPQEIRHLIPNAHIHVISDTAQLIKYHRDWTRAGRPKPTEPTFFIISFTTLRNDCAIRPAVEYQLKQTKMNVLRDGYYCPSCGKPHQTIDSVYTEIEEDKEVTCYETHNMTVEEFGSTRRLQSSVNPANAFCHHCGDSLWTRKVKRRYTNFAEWASHEKRLTDAVLNNNPAMYQYLQAEQPAFASSTSMPRRVAAIEYIRRKMNNFADLAIIDEVHELKGGNTAQGNALGSLVASSKKVIAGTGTLFGGKAEDVYYLFWRLFPHDMSKSGYKFSEVTRFNEEYGNVEETIYEPKESSGVYSNKNSRGGNRTSRKKVVPGISSFIYGKYMLHNVVNVRLVDVWPDPVELVDTPTIFCEMPPALKQRYNAMISRFENEIDMRDDGYKLYTQMIDYGVSYPDNPFTFPDALYKDQKLQKYECIWEAEHLDPNQTLPKEQKLQEIVLSEMAEGRASIVYVRDTGSSVVGRDIRPRLKEKLEEIGAKVCILDTNTTATNNRSEWLKKKIEKEGYNVCIVSQELVKVGLDLLCSPTLIYYQFSWSLFTINQSSRRAWRIGQTKECRLFYLAYDDCYQRYVAELIAKKNAATKAINGEVSSDGLSAMLGDEGDLQSMLIETIKKGGTAMKGTAEDWITQTSDRARELLANIGKPKEKPIKQTVQAINPIQPAVNSNSVDDLFALLDVMDSIQKEPKIVETHEAMDMIVQTKKRSKKSKTSALENQLTLDLFAI